MAFQMARKAYKAKKALKQLEKAKINSWRAAQGLPPLQPCYKMCCDWVREILFETFCPCLIKPKMAETEEEKRKRILMEEKARERKKLSYKLGKCYKKFCFFLIPGTLAHEVFKSFAGFSLGLILTTVMFWYIALELKFSLFYITGFCMVIGFFLTMGLAFVPDLRCLFMLLIPQFFTNQGKGLILGYAFILVMNGPAQNIARNTQLLTASLACGQSLIKNITAEITGEAMAPVKGMVNKIKTIINKVVKVVERGKRAFLAIKELFAEICNSLQKVGAWLGKIFGVCNAKMGAPHDKCMRVFQEAYDNCMRKLKVAKKLCKITTSFRFACKITKHLNRFCNPLERLKNFMVGKIKKGLSKAVQNVYNLFYLNITIQYHFNLTVSQSKDFEEIKRDITNAIKDKIQVFLNLANACESVLALAILLSLFKACSYRKRYLCTDAFDNLYITSRFRDIDDRREKMGKDNLLPLKWREKWTYIGSYSLRMTGGELGKFLIGLIFYLCAVFHLIFYMVADYSIYWMLSLLQGHADVKASDYLPHKLKIDIEGKGMLANMYKEVVGSFEKMGHSVSQVETKTCIPLPYEPDYDVYPIICATLLVVFFLVIFESYGLRLRHIICDFYYPQRAKQRGIYLYNQITLKRNNVLGFMRTQIEQTSDTEEDKVDIRDKLAMQYRCLRVLFKCLGYERKYCSTCCKPGHKNDNERFKECMNSTCLMVYCKECVAESNNICNLCLMPIEPIEGDHSEEIDSSDEEEYKKIRNKKYSSQGSPEKSSNIEMMA
ncbi:unnamed protein product [Gordionus sp. m RMFG-2023]